MGVKDRRTRFRAGVADLDLYRQPAGAQHRGIDLIAAVCRGDDNDPIVAFVDLADLLKKLVDSLSLVLMLVRAATFRRQRVDLVDKDQTRLMLAGFIEESGDVLGALAEPLRDDVGTLDADVVDPQLTGQRL